MSDFKTKSCEDFVGLLASNSPIPGGGGASALVGALAMALGNMVASLTLGKPEYADVEDDIEELKHRADNLQNELLLLIDKDAEAFEPLSRAYRLPKATEEEKAHRSLILEDCLKLACESPLVIMECCCEAIDLLVCFAAKGAAIAISDAGVGIAFARAALQGASLNVFINTKAMTDKGHALRINRRAQLMLEEYLGKADAVFAQVEKRLLNTTDQG